MVYALHNCSGICINRFMNSTNANKDSAASKALTLSCLSLIVICAFIFNNEKHQHSKWIVPFLSGAANFQVSEPWSYNPEDVGKHLNSTSPNQYRFEASNRDDLVQYSASDIGFLYVCVVARNLFPWLGDLDAVRVLQIIVHMLSVVIVLRCLDSCYIIWRPAFVIWTTS